MAEVWIRGSVSVACRLDVLSIDGSWYLWRSTFSVMVYSEAGSGLRLISKLLLLDRMLGAWVFESLVHPQLCGSWLLFPLTTLSNLKVTGHRASLVPFLPKVSLFAWVCSAGWRLVQSCPQNFLRYLIISLSPAPRVKLIDFVGPTKRAVVLGGSNRQVVDRVPLFLAVRHPSTVYSVLGLNHGPVLLPTRNVPIFLSLLVLHPFDPKQIAVVLVGVSLGLMTVYGMRRLLRGRALHLSHVLVGLWW